MGNFSSEPLIALGHMLYDHIRLEEDCIFPRVEKARFAPWFHSLIFDAGVHHRRGFFNYRAVAPEHYRHSAEGECPR